MARKRYADEDVVNLLRQIELSLSSGNSVLMACRSAGVSDATYYTWRRKYGGLCHKPELRARKGHCQFAYEALISRHTASA